MTATYPHKSDHSEKERNYLDENGKVRVHPPNPLAGIKGATDKLYQFPKFMEDPYERKRELEIKERMAHHLKLGEKAPFKSTDFGGKAFTSDKNAYGLDRPMPNKKEYSGPELNILKHDAPFKPSHPPKSGHNGYL